MYPGRTTCIRIHTCRRIHVAGYKLLVPSRSGYMLTLSRRHNYYSFMSRSTYIPLYPATDGRQTGDNFVADTKHYGARIRQHVSWCKRGIREAVQLTPTYTLTRRMAIANGTCVSFCNQPKAHFGLPWIRTWDNRGKCHMDGKRIQCWSNS